MPADWMVRLPERVFQVEAVPAEILTAPELGMEKIGTPDCWIEIISPVPVWLIVKIVEEVAAVKVRVEKIGEAVGWMS